MSDGPFRVLMELRPCLEGFAGIPQETRLLFSSFCDMAGVDVHGLINHSVRELTPGTKVGRNFSARSVHRKYNQLSRFVISHKASPHRTFIEAILAQLRRRYYRLQLSAQTRIGVPLRLYDFDGEAFPDFIWDSIFAKTLSVSEMDKVTSAPFRTMRAPWQAMHRVGVHSWFGQNYPTMKTDKYDLFLAQTPFPGKFPRSTQLAVRYHDAIPVMLPQHIPDTSFHQTSHYNALRSNAAHAVFACTTEAVRSDLLRMFPRLEHRSPVIHDIVSHTYFVEEGEPQLLCETIRNRVNEKTQPKFLTNREKVRFYETSLRPETLRYVMMVSTIEPRKNHSRLIRAWEQVHTTVDPNLKLIIVGELGWDNDRITEAMAPWQARGQLFHLSRVPASDLRMLYNGAACVVCPSIAEGFDLSGIEAMLSGGVVAASDIPVHREVYGNAAAYFHPYSVPQLAKAIETIISPSLAAYRADLRERGLLHAAQYKREAIAPQWEAFFERARAGDFAVRSVDVHQVAMPGGETVGRLRGRRSVQVIDRSGEVRTVVRDTKVNRSSVALGLQEESAFEPEEETNEAAATHSVVAAADQDRRSPRRA